MKVFTTTNEDGFIAVSMEAEYDADGNIITPDGYEGPFDVPDSFATEQHLYRRKDGKLELDKARQAENEAEYKRMRDGEERERKRAASARRLQELQAETLAQAATDDETVIELTPLLPEWEPKAYSLNAVVQYEDEPYKCVQAHDATGNPGWTPDATPALWKGYRAAVEDWPEFVQPTGGHDAYQTGDKVTYKGERYESVIDNNVWSPEGYPAGWMTI
ncbi:MAG: hypothetical protein FWE62_06165 [Firmicutes bacterium]|nr:hypothetical protein [Bacillota bacterium]